MQSPKPLPALQSNVLAASESCIYMPSVSDATTTNTGPESPRATYQSPLQRHIQHVRLQDMVHKADLLNRSNSNARTSRGTAFQPQTRKKGTNSWQLKQFAEATLGSGSLRKVVQLPEGEDRDEWLAVNGKLDRWTEAGYILRLTLPSGRLLQPDQLTVRCHHRVLLTTILSRDEGHRRVRVPVARPACFP